MEQFLRQCVGCFLFPLALVVSVLQIRHSSEFPEKCPWRAEYILYLSLRHKVTLGHFHVLILVIGANLMTDCGLVPLWEAT